MNKISLRQLCFFLACVAPVGKLILLPARLVQFTGNDLIFPALIHILLQAGVIFCVLLLAKSGLSFGELLENTFGKVAGGILTLLYGLFLLYIALVPLLEQELFVQGTFYDTLPSVIAFAPFFLLSAYLCSKPLSSFGRVWDLLGPIAIVGFLGTFAFSAAEADYGALFPIGSAGLKEIARGTAYSFDWFFDSALLLPLLGKIEYRKGMAWKGTLSYLGGGAVVLFFLGTFYSVFEGTAVNQLFAFADASKYFSAITVLGRVDFLFIYALALVMSFFLAMPLQGCVDCAVQVFGTKCHARTLFSLGVNALFFALMIVFNFHFGEVLESLEKFFYIIPVFTLLLPVLCLLLRRKKRERA